MTRQHGYTFPEIIVVVGILAVLFGIGSVGLLRVERRPQLATTANKLIADIKQQQLKAMVGEADSAGSKQPYGIYFASSRYVLFVGATYVPNDSANAPIDLESRLSLTSSLPGNTLVFAKGSGEVVGFTGGQDMVTITQTDNGDSVAVRINALGTVVSGP